MRAVGQPGALSWAVCTTAALLLLACIQACIGTTQKSGAGDMGGVHHTGVTCVSGWQGLGSVNWAA